MDPDHLLWIPKLCSKQYEVSGVSSKAKDPESVCCEAPLLRRCRSTRTVFRLITSQNHACKNHLVIGRDSFSFTG